MIPRFSDVMALRRVGGGPNTEAEFEADLNENWTIGPKMHGGVMVALCAKAARVAYNRGPDDSAPPVAPPVAQPVAVSANFLSAPDPGAVRLVTAVRKRGRRIGLVDVELIQGDRLCVHAVVTLGEPEHDAQPLWVDAPLSAQVPAQPPTDVPEIGPGHPGAAINNLARGCAIHPRVIEELGGDQPLMFTFWVRPKEGPVDEFFALMCGDISLPVSYAVGRRGWAPTVQLTAYLRALPADGWLRVLCTATQIGQDWFDEDHTVLDSTGRIVVQTRQLALVPGR
jgi:acyl-coenzyme A thioesterase PaaI-like protein